MNNYNKKWVCTQSVPTVRKNGIKHYIDPQGRQLPDLDSILRATLSVEAKICLKNFRKKGNNAGAISSHSRLLRQQIRLQLEQKTFVPKIQIQPYWQRLHPWLESLNDVQVINGVVFNYHRGYACQVDCIVNFGRNSYVSLFTASLQPKDNEYDKPLRLAGQCAALNYLEKQCGVKPKLKRTLLITTTPREVIIKTFEEEEVMNHWTACHKRITEFHNQQKAS